MLSFSNVPVLGPWGEGTPSYAHTSFDSLTWLTVGKVGFEPTKPGYDPRRSGLVTVPTSPMIHAFPCGERAPGV